jgi:hypothetical protein
MGLDKNANELTAEDFFKYATLIEPEPMELYHHGAFSCIFAWLVDLSVLELCLIVAVKRLAVDKLMSNFHFDMVYEEYRDFYRKTESAGSRLLFFNKEVAFKAFEKLSALELIVPLSCSQHGASLKQYRMFRCVLDLDEIDFMVDSYENCPASILRWYIFYSRINKQEKVIFY